MATRHSPLVPIGGETGDAALQHPHWRKRAGLSSIAGRAEHFLEAAGFDRAPWLAVALAAGIGFWFEAPDPVWWIIAICAGALVALGALFLWHGAEGRSRLLAACVAVGLVFSGGVGLAWARSVVVGTPPIARAVTARIDGRVLARIEQPAHDRVRLILATRDPLNGRTIKVRVNLPLAQDRRGFGEGALIRLRTRLMPPAPPMLPGGYDFARAAWFAGFAATGSVIGTPKLLEPGQSGGLFSSLQRALSRHVRAHLGGSEGAIAAAFASGDRGAISQADENAMRDAGLTHLLSISGLHVSAVIAAAYFLTIRLLALFPWLALRVRLPIVAAATGAGAGIVYTLLTGAQVPTVRSCIAALLVLGALALGREALSLRMVAVAAIAVLLLWPEALVGPSFQMSFAAVIAIVALHRCAPVRRFLAPREEGMGIRLGRNALVLLLTGVVIELALMPIVLFHFHRAGFYGALANVVAIPLVTFVAMPLIGLALLFDLAGLGAPLWWLAGEAIRVLLGVAHFTASQPGAVKLMPQMGLGTVLLFALGGLWLGLWQGRWRMLGLVPASIACALMALSPVPDLLVTGDGRHVGITGENDGLLVLRDTRSEFTRDTLLEMAGVKGKLVPLDRWPGAKCSRDFCVITLDRAGHDWTVLMSRSNILVTERALAAACIRADIVITDRWLPRSCRPRWLRIDKRTLSRTGGLAIDLSGPEIETVAQGQGQHGWWRGRSGD